MLRNASKAGLFVLISMLMKAAYTGCSGDAETQKQSTFACKNGVKIDWSKRCDGNDDCGNWDDECDCGVNSTLCDWVPCMNGISEIRRRQVCDGQYDCEDLSDECLCDRETEENQNTFPICQQLLGENLKNCTVGNISCVVGTDYTCLPGYRICDGKVDCDDHIDEEFCKPSKHSNSTSKSNLSCIVSKEHESILPLACKCDGKMDLPMGEDERNCSRFFYCSVTANKPNEWMTISTNRSYNFGGVNDSFIDWRRVFDGVVDCQDRSDEWQPRTKLCKQTSPQADSTPLCGALGRRYLSSAEYVFESRAFAVLQWIIGIFTTLANGFVIFTTLRSLCVKSSNSSYAAKTSNLIMVLSLALGDFLIGVKMVAMAILDAIMAGAYWKYEIDWISSSLCTFYGVGTFVTTSASVFTACAITAIRLYAVLYPFKITNVKCVSIACIAVWGLAIIQAIPTMETGIAAFEKYFTYAVVVPNLPQVGANWLTRDRAERLVTMASLLGDMHKGMNDTTVISVSDLKWRDLEAIMVSLNHKLGDWKYYNGFSHSSMCIPPILTSTTREGWEFVIAAFTENFIAYCFVTVAYYIVLKKTTACGTFREFLCFDDDNIRRDVTADIAMNNRQDSVNCDAHNRPMLSANEGLKQRRKKEDLVMQRRILWIIITDIACWTPVCILNYISVFWPHVQVKTPLSLSICIILVELNSMVNPFLYSKQMRKAIKLIFIYPVRLIQCKLNAPIRTSNAAVTFSGTSNTFQSSYI